MYRFILCCLLAATFTGCGTTRKAATAEPGTIPVELTTHLGDQQQFVEGDEIQFLLSLGQDAYIYMYYIDAGDNITQILPNDNQRSNFYSAGYFLTIPEYENLYRFTITAPFGEESIWVLASDRSTSVEQSQHSIDDIRRKIRRSSRSAYGEYQLHITTRERSGR